MAFEGGDEAQAVRAEEVVSLDLGPQIEDLMQVVAFMTGSMGW